MLCVRWRRVHPYAARKLNNFAKNSTLKQRQWPMFCVYQYGRHAPTVGFSWM